ncbi:MAG: NADH-quinone oxidoreductase subunit L, partial [Actinomycetia bacterium]|nr:NADH-quinone oxidoreductase subunit L [Actinomycetes bacterium]
AMEGPTPVSALIHAATMVAAGVYLVARSYPIFYYSESALIIVAYVGAITSLFAATIAIAVDDIKKVLAYSTISKLGSMITALGVGGLTAGMFHLVTHAFFKSLLFLGAGSVIHSTHTQDIKQMGGLYKKMKITAITFTIGALSLAGVPPLAGFWSEDEILQSTFTSGNTLIFAMTLITVFITSIYATRLCYLVFFAKPKKEKDVHESPPVMTFPLVVLAVFAAFIGLIGSPLFKNWFQHFIFFKEPHVEINFGLMGISIFIVLSGILMTWIMYSTKVFVIEDLNKTHLRVFYQLFRNKYYFDEIVNIFVIKPYMKISHIFFWIDKNIIDGIVNFTAWACQQIGEVVRKIQNGKIQPYIMISVGSFIVLIITVLLTRICW